MKTRTEPASETLCEVTEQLTKSPKKKNVSVNFCHAVFSLLDFSFLETGTDRLCQNVGAELPL